MFQSEGFWGFLSSLVYAGIFVLFTSYFRKGILELVFKRDFSVKVAGQELTVQTAAKQLGVNVAELQSRVAALESKTDEGGFPQISRNDGEKRPDSIRRILWVDDYPSNNAFIVDRLRSEKFEIDIALSTEAGMKSFVAFDPHIIISDLGRIENGVDNLYAGLDLIKQIRIVNQTIPILIFAGSRGTKMRDNLIAAGASDVTSSGVDVMKFIEKHTT